MANQLISKLIKNNTTLTDIYEILEANNLSTQDFFIALDYWINDLPLLSSEQDESHMQEAIATYVELMWTLSDLNYHLVNKVEDESLKASIAKGLGGFVNASKTFDTKGLNVEKYKSKRKEVLYKIPQCKEVIDLLLQHLKF